MDIMPQKQIRVAHVRLEGYRSQLTRCCSDGWSALCGKRTRHTGGSVRDTISANEVTLGTECASKTNSDATTSARISTGLSKLANDNVS